MLPRSSEEGRRDASPSLNLDVLQRILHFAPVADLRQAVLVSRAIYEVAIREILIRGIRFDGSPTKLESFCRFMLERNPPLFPFLRNFELVRISSDNFDPSDLLQVLSRATYLNELRIHWSDKDSPNLLTPTDTHDTSLATIFPQLQSLRRIQLHDVPKDIASSLLALPPQLRVLEVSSNPLDPVEFPPTLGTHLAHLCALRIYYPNLARAHEWEPFRSVRHLSILWPDSIPLSLRLLATTFPSLRELFLGLGRPGRHVDPSTLPPNQAGVRAGSLAFQTAASGGGGWPRLAMLSTTTAAEAWMLAVGCRVRAVRLGAYEAGRHATFVDVVARVRPAKIAIALECKAGCVHPHGAQSLFHLPAPSSGSSEGAGHPAGSQNGGGFSPVTHAVVFMVVPSTSGEEAQGAPGIAEIIGSHLRHSRLHYLHVVIPPDERLKGLVFMQDERHIYTYALRQPRQTQAQTTVDSDTSSPSRAPSRFADIDIPLLVSSLATAGSRLRTIVLTIAERGQSVWRIDRSVNGHAQMISRVTDPVLAKAVIAEEEHV